MQQNNNDNVAGCQKKLPSWPPYKIDKYRQINGWIYSNTLNSKNGIYSKINN